MIQLVEPPRDYPTSNAVIGGRGHQLTGRPITTELDGLLVIALCGSLK